MRPSIKFDPENDKICKKILDCIDDYGWTNTNKLLNYQGIEIDDDNEKFFNLFQFQYKPVKILFKYIMEKLKEDEFKDVEVSEYSQILKLPTELADLTLKYILNKSYYCNKNQPLITKFLCDGIREIYKICPYQNDILWTVMDSFVRRPFDFSIKKVIETILSLDDVLYNLNGSNYIVQPCLLEDIIHRIQTGSLENIEDNLITPEFIDLLNEHHLLNYLYIDKSNGVPSDSLLMVMIDSDFVKPTAVIRYLDLMNTKYSNTNNYFNNEQFIEYINYSDAYGMTALDLAVNSDDQSVALKLLEYGVEYGQAFAPYGGSSSHLIESIEHKNFDIAKKFIELRPSMIDDVAEYRIYKHDEKKHYNKRLNVYGAAVRVGASEIIEIIENLKGPDLVAIYEEEEEV